MSVLTKKQLINFACILFDYNSDDFKDEKTIQGVYDFLEEESRAHPNDRFKQFLILLQENGNLFQSVNLKTMTAEKVIRPKVKDLQRKEIIKLVGLLYRFQLMVEGDDTQQHPKQIGQVVKRIDNYLK